MSKTTSTKVKSLKVSQEKPAAVVEKPKEKTIEKAKPIDNDFQVVLEGQAKKLSPKTEGHIRFQLIKDKSKTLHLKMVSNSNGGNFSKNPIPFKLIESVLSKQDKSKSFKSTILKEAFVGKGSKSANNTSFLAAVLRSKEIALIVPSDKSQFLSNLSPEFKVQSKKLLAL